MKSEAELKTILETLEAAAYRKKYGGQYLFFEPYERQKEFFAFGAEKRERLLIAGNQNGKELRVDCPVLTPDGWVEIGRLAVGDPVIAGDGSVTTVTGIYPQGIKPLVEIEFCYGQKIVAGYEHLWKVLPPHARFRRRSETFREGGEKRTREVPNERHGTWEVWPTAAMRAKHGDEPPPKYRFATPAVGAVLFTPRDVPMDPYLVGVLLGDGALTQGLRLSSADVEIVRQVEATVERSGGVVVRSKGRAYDFRITHSPALMDAARSLGLIGKGAAEKRVPPSYLWNSPEVRLAVLQGLMDTDGTCEKGGQTSFTSISEGLADDVIFLARSFGAKCRKRQRITSYRHHGERRFGKPSFTVTIRLPGVPLFRLARKLARVRRPGSTTDHNLIVSFREVAPAEAVCISVDHPERTYVIKDFIVTHNSHAGGFEAALHLTGDYPDWWVGRRWDRPTRGWMAGETSLAVRDILQKKLCGEPGVDEAFGTGMIPKDRFADKPSLARGVTDAFDTIQVRHKSGGVSVARFKSYEQGRAKFQGETLDWLWFDEEPPEDVYSEGLTRTVATGGMAFTTFTPLKGRSSVVMRFLDEPSPDRAVVTMTIDDALHIPAEERARIIAGYLPHEREARARGVPTLGSGRVFMASEESITEAAIEAVPDHWVKLWGIDFGIGHPFGAALVAWDRDNDVLHVLHCIRVADALPIMHAQAMKKVAAAVPVAWPRDGTNRDARSGEPLAAGYSEHGLLMMPEHATWPDGSLSTEAGIMEMDERMQSGRFKVAAHLSDWLEEFRFYHRKDGQIVKIKDDLMSATRIAVMMKRFAKAVKLGSAGFVRPQAMKVYKGRQTMRRVVG
ncbi:MAG: hypothetical protein IT562_10805 [Alphaproteobacteria bacterium]|nr:hypothetical protein [Alphaproteobacteria bacterium]